MGITRDTKLRNTGYKYTTQYIKMCNRQLKLSQGTKKEN